MKDKVWIIGDLQLNEDVWKTRSEHSTEEQFFIEYNDVVGKNDMVIFLGNIAIANTAQWFNRIKELPGQKALLLGSLERNRPKWYEKFGFDVIVPFNEASIAPHPMGKILLSHLPAFHESGEVDKKYFGLVNKFGRLYDYFGCILNIHGHLMGRPKNHHKAFNASLHSHRVLGLDQIMDHKFKND